MGKSVTIDQSHSVIAILATNVEWETLDVDILQKEIINKPREAGKQFTAFLKNGAKLIIGESKIVKIDRSKPFDPVSFIGKGWNIEEQDERSLALTELDLTKVQFKTILKDNEKIVEGEKKLRRLKEAGYIRLDARIFQTLWENQYLIPEKWKEKTEDNIIFIYFDGTILRCPSGSRCVLSLCWLDGEWDWGYSWLEGDWRVGGPSAVLASS